MYHCGGRPSLRSEEPKSPVTNPVVQWAITIVLREGGAEWARQLTRAAGPAISSRISISGAPFLSNSGRKGFSQAQSVKATVERLGVPLAEAKKIVHLTDAWADVRAENDSFHQGLDEAAGNSR